jgi:hypothetical protein
MPQPYTGHQQQEQFPSVMKRVEAFIQKPFKYSSKEKIISHKPPCIA